MDEREPVVDSERFGGDRMNDAAIENRRFEDRDYNKLGLSTVFVGVHPPRGSVSHRRRRRNHNRERGHHHDHSLPVADGSAPTEPKEHVKFLLGEDDDENNQSEMHPIFCEMDELVMDESTGFGGNSWKETARWIKFEEDVEDGGERWSKPRVATLQLFSLFEVRKTIHEGIIMLNVAAKSLDGIADLVLDRLISEGQLRSEFREQVREVLLRRHTHLHEKRSHAGPGFKISSFANNLKKNYSTKDVMELESNEDVCNKECGGIKRNESSMACNLMEEGNCPAAKFDHHFMKKIPQGAETSNILVGDCNFLPKPISAFIRLEEAELLGNLTEVPVPTRFIYILLGPVHQTDASYACLYESGAASSFHEMGRSMATLMSDEIFHDVAYKARNREDLLMGIDEFLSSCHVLPPGEWDPKIRIEPPKEVPSQDLRKSSALANGETPGNANGHGNHSVEGGNGGEPHVDTTLIRTGRLFGGLINDIKRRKPHYISDFKDGLHIQTFGTFCFLYFACLTPIIAFGGLLIDATGGYLGVVESLLSGTICGVIFALFSGQPLIILGSTGPVLVFESIIYNMCLGVGWNYLSFRLLIGLWIAVILFVMVAFDLSAWVRYITRFTEESFAALIAMIFIVSAFKKLIDIGNYSFVPNPNWHPKYQRNFTCRCAPLNDTIGSVPQQMSDLITLAFRPPLKQENNTNENATLYYIDYDKIDLYDWDYTDVMKRCVTVWKSRLVDCDDVYVPDIFFFSCLLFLGTFGLAFTLKNIRTSRFFPNRARAIISDFAVMIAILSMTIVDALAGFHTPKLIVPTKFEPTLAQLRGWIVPLFNGNPFYTVFVAFGPALLAVILIFMDQQITAVIVNRRENKLKKGAGYHLDLLIVALLIAVNSLLGIPWFVAATVLSINHVISLKKESESSAPGERPKFLGCRENRLTGVLIFITVGLSVFMTPVLKFIPLPVLYGVFLFMGVASMKGVQLVQRISIWFMPQKHQPDYVFLRHVPTMRVHLFTVIQVSCLALLWVIKIVTVVSIAFPLMVLAMCFIRKSLEFIFSMHDLRWLDDIMPESHSREKDNDKNKAADTAEEEDEEVDMCSATTTTTKKQMFNISDEVGNTSIWKQLTASQLVEKEAKEAAAGCGGKSKSRRHRRRHQHDKFASSEKRNRSPHTKNDSTEERQRMLSSPKIVVQPPSRSASFEGKRSNDFLLNEV